MNFPYTKYDPESRPDSPLRCSCGCTTLRWNKGFRGTYYEPPEANGWMCVYCENMDFAPEDFLPLEEAPDLFEAMGLEPVKFPEVRCKR